MTEENNAETPSDQGSASSHCSSSEKPKTVAPFKVEQRDGLNWATFDESVIESLFGRDDISVSREERDELETQWSTLAEQGE